MSTLQRRKKEFNNIEQHIRAGKAKGLLEVSSALFDSANGRNGRDPSVKRSNILFKDQSRKKLVTRGRKNKQVDNNINLSEIITSANARIIEHQADALPSAPKEIDIKQLNKATKS